MVPPELQEQFYALQREVLLTIRALIDWYLERLDPSSSTAGSSGRSAISAA
jgi:hypothetical protein